MVVNNPLIRPAISWGGGGIGGYPSIPMMFFGNFETFGTFVFEFIPNVFPRSSETKKHG